MAGKWQNPGKPGADALQVVAHVRSFVLYILYQMSNMDSWKVVKER
ncbi:MAG: hypothetical protein LUG99_23440 [Lachnospiraceae bacterium]|nr:hypothetical protein [Lachnospiraceae bacterium]